MIILNHSFAELRKERSAFAEVQKEKERFYFISE